MKTGEPIDLHLPWRVEDLEPFHGPDGDVYAQTVDARDNVVLDNQTYYPQAVPATVQQAIARRVNTWQVMLDVLIFARDHGIVTEKDRELVAKTVSDALRPAPCGNQQ